jgi:hypothetical protein
MELICHNSLNDNLSFKLLRQTLQDVAPSHDTIFWYFLKFKRRRTPPEDEDTSGQPTTEVTEENIPYAEIMTKDSQTVYTDIEAR